MTSSHGLPAQDGQQPDDLQQPQHDRSTQSDRHSHTHAHSHAKLHHAHNHLHHPADLKARDSKDTAPDSKPPAEEAKDDGVPYFTHVVQTIQLIYGTDAAGLPTIQTITRPPATVVVDSQSGETIAAISAQAVVTPPAPAPEPASSDVPPPSEALATEPAAPLTTAIKPDTPDAHTASSLSVESEDLTSAPLPPSSAASLASHHNNATHTPHSADSYIHSATNSTSMKAFDFSSTPVPATTTSSSSRSFTFSQTTFSSFISSSTGESSTSTTVVGAGGGGGLSGGEEDQAQPTAGADTPDEPLSPREKQIVGGVVGGVAGAAFFMLLILLALRYKKRKQNHLALEDDDGNVGSRGITGGGGSGGQAMTQRSSMPTGVAAALASLSGKRKPPPEPAPTGERGFYRVSGRKLQSVLQTGGDGYTDPHASVASGTSDYYRGSQAFEPNASNRLALGSPMRPASGVMIMRDGPGRTPVTEQNPFADPPSPPPTRGPAGTLGRSHPSHDGSAASGSRFREGI